MNINQLKTKLNKISNAQTQVDVALRSHEWLEDAIKYIFSKTNESLPKNASLLELIDNRAVLNFVNDDEIIKSLHFVRTVGMNAKHGETVKKSQANIAKNNVYNFMAFLEAKESGTVTTYYKPHYMSEADTRKEYIDLYLKEAGWEVLDKEDTALPTKAGIEIKVEGMPNTSGFGFCDYVLYGRDCRPLAIVEAKKTSETPEKGRHQVELYGECMEKIYGYKPVLYYTNGYTIKVMDGIYPDRTVMAFHTLEDLELLIQRRKRNDITDLTINDEITNRPYQKIAITKICEWLNEKHRRGLLVMATGTGKTRVAVSLVDVLARNKWVKNVLFLADRTTLVSQAKSNFSKLMPNMSVCELSGDDKPDFNARLMFCTYQTMINYIDAEEKRFSTGRFDLIIIDEAHRSIFNRYGSIFQYFDSLLIGLTATPRNEIDANTYRIFGCEAGIPNFDYTLEEAIKEKYLVGYNVINRTSKMLTQGITYGNLTEEEKEQLDQYFVDDEDKPTPDFNISGNEIFKVIFNKDTCRQVLEELMCYGLRVDNGETIGKTIIFAYNHKHAQMIVDCFNEMYPKYNDACRLVDYSVNYSKDLVRQFDEDDSFRIAVSVDMLDTGVDVPAVLNLVFFKVVHSKIKFVQMIGRGTRLCENVYGNGKHKTGFQIFDYCGNFEYFGENPDGKLAKPVLTLSQRLFQVRLDMLYELQNIEYQEDDWFREYYEEIKQELYDDVCEIKEKSSSRIQVREEMQYLDKYCDFSTWEALSPVMLKELKSHIAPLLDSGLNGNHLMVSFDVRMYQIEKALLAQNSLKGAVEHVKNVRLIADYLIKEKASMSQVREKSRILKKVASEGFWRNPTVQDLEKARAEIRELVKFLAGEGKIPHFDVDIKDELSDAEYEVDGTMIDIRTYREKVIDYLAEHLDSDVIRKIHNLEPINNDDLEELEHILWNELGTQIDYNETTDIENLAAFVRSLIGLSQEAVNEKFGEYLNGNIFNSQQQEFVRVIINYVRENGDISIEDMVNTEPFSNYDLYEIFGVNLNHIVSIVNLLHGSVQVVGSN